MKTILVPTDFSNNTDNVISYVGQLCKAIHAKIVLFHVYSPPITTSELPDMQPLHYFEEASELNLKRLADKMQVEHGLDLEITTESKCGFVLDEILYYLQENQVDLVVMGMQGTGYLAERLFGSNTTSLMYKANTPILTVGEKVLFRPIQKIVLACDFKLENLDNLQPMIQLATLFNAHIHLLSVVENTAEIVKLEDSTVGIQLRNLLQTVPFSIHYTKDDDIVNGITEYIESQHMDLVVMIPKAHTFFENIFHEPNTKRMAFHTNIPLLALPQIEK